MAFRNIRCHSSFSRSPSGFRLSSTSPRHLEFNRKTISEDSINNCSSVELSFCARGWELSVPYDCCSPRTRIPTYPSRLYFREIKVQLRDSVSRKYHGKSGIQLDVYFRWKLPKCKHRSQTQNVFSRYLLSGLLIYSIPAFINSFSAVTIRNQSSVRRLGRSANKSTCGVHCTGQWFHPKI